MAPFCAREYEHSLQETVCEFSLEISKILLFRGGRLRELKELVSNAFLFNCKRQEIYSGMQLGTGI